MKAIVITQPGGPEVLQLCDVPTPEPGPNELLIAVKATAVNRLDLLQCRGLYPAPPGSPTDIPGVEYAGVVVSCGESHASSYPKDPTVNLGYKPGDCVFGLVGGGSYAQYIVAHERTVMRIPDGLSFQDAAAIPEVFVTAHDALLTQANLKSGETALINAVGSGVGTAAIQIAKAFGAKTIGTARSANKVEAARTLGLDEGIVVSDNKFAQEVLRLTAGDGVNVVLELAGGLYVSEDIACMAPQARMIVVGIMAGAKCQLDLGLLLRKRLQIRGTTLRARSLKEKISVMEKFTQQMLPLIANRSVKAIIDRTFPLDKVADAHKYAAANKNFGKVVLDLNNL